MTPAPFRVMRRTRETADTWTLELAPESRRDLGAFRPGQFAMLYAFGAGEAPISVSGDLAEAARLVHTIRAVGTVTETLCGYGAGAALGVRGPFGTPWPVEAAEGGDVVVVAGGLGLAPLRSAIYQVLQNRDRYGSVAILYGSRSPDDLLYAAELERWRSRFDLHVHVTVDGAPSDWRGRVGVVTKLIAAIDVNPASTTALVCGPEVMMRFAAAALEDRGLARDRIFLSLERSMHCAIGLCGHCQLREFFVCKDGPVFSLEAVEPLMRVREL